MYRPSEEVHVKGWIRRIGAGKEGDVGMLEAAFNIKRDGSLANIRLTRSSCSKIIDDKAVQILWKIGESHALGPISDLTSNTIRLELTGCV